MSGTDGKRLSAGTGNAVPNRLGFLFPAAGNPVPGRRESESRPAGDHSGARLMSGGVRFNVPVDRLSACSQTGPTVSRQNPALPTACDLTDGRLPIR